MIQETQRTDTIANNLANVNTTGYKRDVAVSSEFEPISSMGFERMSRLTSSICGRFAPWRRMCQRRSLVTSENQRSRKLSPCRSPTMASES